MQTDWRPTASLTTLHKRAALLAQLRAFFAARAVLEVDTPALMPTTATDLYIDSFCLNPAAASSEGLESGDQSQLYLQTSPEFPLKRLLAAGSGAIYQLGKVFRNEQASPQHSREFTMLEWYRPGFTLEQLMDEVELLVNEVLTYFSPECKIAPAQIPRLRYRDLFFQHLSIDPHRASDEAITRAVDAHIDLEAANLSRTDKLQLLLSHCIEPLLPPACFITDYPAAQAALARVEPDAQGDLVARRFELFVNGMELANGYYELTDAQEQRRRFDADNDKRSAQGKETLPIDEALLAALEHGLPDCAGVALGVDRLLMVAIGAERIEQVLSFSQR